MSERLADDGREGDSSVPLLRWPSESSRAQCLEASGLPFLLLVGQGEPPPLSGYRFMDWVRSPIDPDEIVVRRESLQERFLLDRAGARPRLDDMTCRLTFGHASAGVAPSQIEALRTLVGEYRDIVPISTVRSALGVSATDSEGLFATRLVRLRRAVRRVGLDITRVRGVGFALEPDLRQKHVR